MEHRVVFSSDLHGRPNQYDLLTYHARVAKAKTLILGGDLLPKNQPLDGFVQFQRDYIREKLIHLLAKLKDQCPDMNIFLIMGNDDVSINLDELMKGHPDVFQVIHGTRARINHDYEIVGYPHIPLSHVRLKDWDKCDMPESEVPERFMEGHRLRMREQDLMFGFPFKSDVVRTPWGSNLYGFRSASEEEILSAGYISEDLAQPVFTKNPENTVHVMHAPPYGTNLDQNKSGHVGSIAERLFIEQHQPYVTLHGHIHSTVDHSGSFREKIGRTHSFSSGNSPKHKDSLKLVEFDLYKPEGARRLSLSI